MLDALRFTIQSSLLDQRAALVLLAVGFAGVVFEFLRPGRAWPGAIGAACMVLAGWGLVQAPETKKAPLSAVVALVATLGVITACLLYIAWRGYQHKQL